jgi:hypothetical protein
MFKRFTKRSTNSTENAAPSSDSLNAAIDLGWRDHSAITDWTAKVDAKASIVLAVELAIFAAFVTLSGRDRPLYGLHDIPLVALRAGLIVLLLAIAMAAFVVFPRLAARQAKRDWASNAIYFGHLRHWKPRELATFLQDLSLEEHLEMLARQLVVTSRIAWKKHVWLQRSIVTAAVGSLLVALASWLG